ncbi:MAG: MFS transporter [Terriglobales bacterium]
MPDSHRVAFDWSHATAAQRNTLWAAGLGWMLDAFDVLLYSLVLTRLITELGMSKATAGLLNSLTLVASAVGSIVIGVLADRYGRRRMLSASILIYSLFSFACGLARSVIMLALFRFGLGVGMGGEWNSGAAMVAEAWPTERRGRAMGLVQSSWAVGYALAAAVAGFLLPRTSWRMVFFVGVVPALLTLWIRRSVPETAPPPVTADPFRVRFRAAWSGRRHAVLALLAMNTCGMFAWWGLFTWLPAYLELPLAQGGRGFQLLGTTQLLVLLNLCGMLPGYLVFGVLADRFGRKPTLVAYLAAAALLVPVFAAARTPFGILVAGGSVAFFGTGFFTGSGIIGSELFPAAIRATALGLTYTGARGLSALAPVVIGRLAERRGLSYAFGASGIGFALAALAALTLPETRGGEASASAAR